MLLRFAPILLILVIAVIVQAVGWHSKRERWQPIELRQLLPAPHDGWSYEDQPIAQSPELLKAVKGILSFDSAVFRVYRRGTAEISIYVAYWMPGKVHPQAVDAHTPDICWPSNGWTMTRLPSLPEIKLPSGRFLPTPNHRRFEIQGKTVSVLFWHIMGSDFRESNSTFEEGLSFPTRVRRRIYQVLNSVTNQPRQQLFVRISSSGEIDKELSAEPIAGCLELIDRALGGEKFYAVVNSN